MRRVTGILLALCFAALGSGALHRLHNYAHALGRPDDVQCDHSDSGGVPADGESDCPLHVLLNLPILRVAVVPFLVCPDLLVGSVTTLAPRTVARRILVRLDCRGPPAVHVR